MGTALVELLAKFASKDLKQFETSTMDLRPNSGTTSTTQPKP
jgi:hypothetical protein